MTHPVNPNLSESLASQVPEKPVSEEEDSLRKEADVNADRSPKQMERIVAAAILQDGVVYTGTRHGFIIRDIVLMAGEKLVTGEQGFVTSKGVFVSREIAGEIALRAGQVRSLKYSRTQLFSEDVWDIPSGLESTEEELSALFPEKPSIGSPADGVAAEGGLIKLSQQQEQIIKEWAADSPHGDLWGNDEARNINLHTFARSILAASLALPKPETEQKLQQIRATLVDCNNVPELLDKCFDDEIALIDSILEEKAARPVLDKEKKD